LTGFDRALIYRFDADWHGETIAEDKAADWEQSFLGLHFPASDIPVQAKALYSLAPIRWMERRDYEPVPVLSLPSRGAETLDLSFTRLRSMSPSHRAYHRNMGVDGSMSVPLMSGNRLWGLLVLHHHGPWRVPPGRRSVLMALVSMPSPCASPQAEAVEAERARAKISPSPCVCWSGPPGRKTPLPSYRAAQPEVDPIRRTDWRLG
jgi:light-regulated signal transduction histidine kinase (bacteriophytochrome)